MQPYQSDYELVVDEIVNRTTGKPRLDSDVEKDIFSNRRQDFTEETSLMQQMETYNAQTQNLADNITNVEEVLKRLDQYITTGLDVSVTIVDEVLVDNMVTVTAGYGVAYGKIQTLTADQSVAITFDDITPVYYVQIDNNAVVINKIDNVRMLTVAKIIVPYPGQTSAIQDDKPAEVYGEDTGYNGWVESAKDAYFGEDTVFDDASREIIREALSQIAAEIIFGTLTASESLKVTNTQGTVVLDSRAMEFRDAYGLVLAHYGSDYARIGDMALYPTYLESTNYIPDVSGFRIHRDGYAEFEDVKVRGALSTTVFEKHAVSSITGSVFVSKGDVLDMDMTSLDSSLLRITGDVTFEIGEILRIKDGVADEWMEVTAIDHDNNIYAVLRDKKEIYSPNQNPQWKKGTVVVSYELPGETFIFISKSEINSPYIDFFSHEGEPWHEVFYKCRIGNLGGIPGCEGYGFYGGVGYLGELDVIDIISIGSQGAIRSNLEGEYPYLQFSNEGLMLNDGSPGGVYGGAHYGADRYGYGALAWIMNSTLKVPFAVLKEPGDVGAKVADIRHYNRGSDPGGAAQVGDVCVVNSTHKICTAAGTPGTFVVTGTQA